jgi:pilus assembly protein CpaC
MLDGHEFAVHAQQTSPAKSSKKSLTRDESESSADYRTLNLTAVEDRVVDLSLDLAPEGGADAAGFGKLVSVANPDMVRVIPVPQGDGTVARLTQIIFRPVKAGETTVTVRNKLGDVKIIFRVIISPSNLEVRMSELKELLRDIEGLEIRIVGQKILLDGDILVLSDYGRLINVISDKVYADQIINLTKISNLSLEYVRNRILTDPKFPKDKVGIRILNEMLVLEGTVQAEDERTLAEQVAKLYAPEIKLPSVLVEKAGGQTLAAARGLVQNLIEVVPPKQDPKEIPKEKLIRVRVDFVELAKDYNRIFGFTWRPGFTSSPTISIGQDAAGDQAAQAASFSATLSNLFPKLQSAQNAGFARIIKSATLIVRNGKTGETSEETSFPVSIFSSSTGQVTSTDSKTSFVGIKFSVTPQVMGQTEDILLDLNVGQSSVVGRAPAAGTAPITATHTVKTNLFIKSGESAAIVGTNSGEVSTQFNKDDPSPGSFSEGTEPLFNLNRSKQYGKKKSQFVIFVTPQIIESAHEGTEDLQRNLRVKVN